MTEPIRCDRCGTENVASAKFCVECGSRMASGCPSCGFRNLAGAKFCAECGQPQATDAASGSGRPVSTPSTTTQRERIAERRHVTVLFADLVGFTSSAENQDPEETRDLLSRYFETARGAIERYGGTVEKFIGDAVMAVWGTPVAHEDDAERAVRAALELVELASELRLGDRALELRAGVLTGETAVTIGATGEGMVAGDIVNTASRLQAAAQPGTVLAGESTQQATREAIAYEPAGEHEMKGKTLPVPAWRALRVIGGRKGSGRSSEIEPPFVGRDAELRTLKELLDAVTRDRKSWLVSIVGQPGIGKSRLTWEFEKYIDGLVQGIFWHQGRSPSYGEGVTFWALGEMVRQRAGLAEQDDAETVARKLHEALVRYVPDETERAWMEPRLEALLGIGEAPSGDDQSELFAAWRRLFERLSEEDTTVLVFEDLQWADAGLVAFIESLLEWSRSRPILVVTLSRPEILDRHPGWGAGQWNATSIHLEPLGEGPMRELLTGIAPGLPDAAVATILDRAEGVPLYAVETVRMLLDTGRLHREGDVVHLQEDLVELAVPPSLHALVAARLDAVDPADRTLLQDASVLGQTFSLPAISALSGVDEAELEPRLAGLVRRELIARVTDERSPERGQFAFVQGILREVAHETLSRRDRRARHLAAARYYEGIGDDELAGLLATHYLEAHRSSPAGEEADAVAVQARIALRAAAERAAALHSHDQAVAFLNEALSITIEPGEQAELLDRAGASALSAGRVDDAKDHFSRALEIHRSSGELHRAALVTARLGSAHMFGGDAAAAIESLRAALDELGDSEDPAVPPLTALLGRAYMLSERPAEAIETLDRALVSAARTRDRMTVAEALVSRGPSLHMLGRTDEAVAVLVGAVRLAETIGSAPTQLRGTLNLAGRMASEDLRGAFELAREGVELARRTGLWSWLTALAEPACNFALITGEWDWVLERADELAGSPLPLPSRVGVGSVAATVHAYRGDRDRANAILDEVSELAHASQDPQVRMSYAFTLHDLAFIDGRYDDSIVAAMDARRWFRLASAEAFQGALTVAVIAADRERASALLAEARRDADEGIIDGISLPVLDAVHELVDAERPGEGPAVRDALRRMADAGALHGRVKLLVALGAVLGADDERGDEAFAEARRYAESRGGHALLERIEEIAASSPVFGRGRPASAAAATSAEAASDETVRGGSSG